MPDQFRKAREDAHGMAAATDERHGPGSLCGAETYLIECAEHLRDAQTVAPVRQRTLVRAAFTCWQLGMEERRLARICGVDVLTLRHLMLDHSRQDLLDDAYEPDRY